MKTILATTVLGLIGCVAGQNLLAAEHANDPLESAKVLATEVCSVCHGPGGRSTFSATPNLAAQPRQYLLGKMKLFRDRSLGKTEGHLDVLGLTLIDDPAADALARYFASQPAPTPVPGDAALIAAGNKIYSQGSAEHKVAACSVCHGADGAGFWIFPRLAGQHAEYVQHRLELIQSHLRDSPVMHGIIKDMTPDEMKAVAAFVQSK